VAAVLSGGNGSAGVLPSMVFTVAAGGGEYACMWLAATEVGGDWCTG